MVDRPLATVNPEVDWEIAVRQPCLKCGTSGHEPGDRRGSYTCLACGGRGYLNTWMKLDDLRDILAWRERRDRGPAGGA